MATLEKIDELIGVLQNSSSNCKENDSKEADAEKGLNLYCAWFCPFAQRAWIGLLLKKLDFKYNEVDPYDKSKEWLAINPRGLVPAIIDYKSNKNGKNIVYESTIILEYLDDMYSKSNGQSQHNLFPSNPFDKAMARVWIDHINKKIIRHFYQILQFREKDKQIQAAKDFFRGVDELLVAMNEKGPFFGGNEISAVDINILPWAARLFLLKHYRNVDYKDYIGESVKNSDSENGKEKQLVLLKRYETWWSACADLEAFKATKADDNRLIAKYKRYADNTAKTLVADAVNQGLPMP